MERGRDAYDDRYGPPPASHLESLRDRPRDMYGRGAVPPPAEPYDRDRRGPPPDRYDRDKRGPPEGYDRDKRGPPEGYDRDKRGPLPDGYDRDRYSRDRDRYGSKDPRFEPSRDPRYEGTTLSIHFFVKWPKDKSEAV